MQFQISYLASSLPMHCASFPKMSTSRDRTIRTDFMLLNGGSVDPWMSRRFTSKIARLISVNGTLRLFVCSTEISQL